MQYNNWCKRNGVYNGSYLPENPNTLTKKGKGWVETQGKPDKTVRNFTRKSSGQRIRYDKENKEQISHYHWKNAKSVQEERKLAKKIQYKDRYGNVCSENDDRHHLAPLDNDCPKNAKKKKES